MGRNRELLSERDKALLVRYHYWSDEKRIRFDDVLCYLSKEFYISEDRIMAILRREKKS